MLSYDEIDKMGIDEVIEYLVEKYDEDEEELRNRMEEDETDEYPRDLLKEYEDHSDMFPNDDEFDGSHEWD